MDDDIADACVKKMAELRAENTALKAELAAADESLKAVEKALSDVDYKGTYAEGVLYLKQLYEDQERK